MLKIEASLEAIALQIPLFCLSIAGAWIVLRVLKGTAAIKNNGIQFRGGAAMFVAIFVLLNWYVPGLRDGILDDVGKSVTIPGFPDFLFRIETYCSAFHFEHENTQILVRDYKIRFSIDFLASRAKSEPWS